MIADLLLGCCVVWRSSPIVSWLIIDGKVGAMQYDPNKWPACWILELIAQDRLHEFYTSGLWLRARARALRNQHRECQRCKARGLIVIEGDRREDGSVVHLTVHHINRVRERPDLALMEYTPGGKRNLEVLCDSCHWHEHHKAAVVKYPERW